MRRRQTLQWRAIKSDPEGKKKHGVFICGKRISGSCVSVLYDVGTLRINSLAN